ncbi:MAG: hypothetical protein ACMG57_01530 [Candidatus Dojkabacteria bacterium]
MGLLDFLSSKPATNTTGQGGLVVTPPTSQNYTSTQQDPVSVIQKDYKELQYPMPGAANPQLGATAIPDANGLQPKLTYATETLPPVTPTSGNLDLPHIETILDNGVRQVNHSSDVLPAASALEQVPQYSYSSNPVPADVMLEQAQAAAEAQEVQQLDQTLPALDSEVTGNPLPVPTEVPGVSVIQPTPEQQLPEQSVDESHNGDIIEIGSAAENPVSDESQKSVALETPVTEVTTTVAEAPVSEVTTSVVETPVAESPVNVTPIPEVAPAPLPIVEVTPVEVTQPLQPFASEQPIVEVQAQPDIQPVVETPIVEEKPLEVPVVAENKIETEATSLNVLNKVAFVSLNSQSVNSSLSKKIKSLAEMISPMISELYIDSNKGYGMDIISGLSGSKLKVTAAYLKPFFSKYSDETNLDVPIENLTRVTFSTVLDRIKFLYKEATVFIIPETAGLNSLSQVTLLLNSQSMYFGTHKPVILFGTAWKDRINTLKASFGLSEQEVSSMNFASTPEEVISLLQKLDAEFSGKNIQSNTVIDMRDEQGEKEGLLSA